MSKVIALCKEQPTGHLRFVRRDDNLILQMQWYVETLGINESKDDTTKCEWRDVPTSEEINQ